MSHTPTQPLTVAAAVARAAQRLSSAGLAFGHGTTNAEDEAAWLVLWRLGLPLDSDLSDAPDSIAHRTVTAEEAAAVDALIDHFFSSPT